MFQTMFPKANTARAFHHARRALLRYGLEHLRQELVTDGFIDSLTDNMATVSKPSNVFACIASGVMPQESMKLEQDKLGDLQDHYVVACNREASDSHWNSRDPEWCGKASMAKGHVFLTVKDLHWEWFNILTFGLVSGPEGALAKLTEMKKAALRWTSATDGWPPAHRVGLFFHVYGHNSVNSCHLHVVNLDYVGPSYAALKHKNLPLDAAIAVLEKEVQAARTAPPDLI